jgi:hypothetical protein
MSHHFERLEEIKATRDRLKKSNSQEAHDRYSIIDPQLGNINEDNTLAFIMSGGPVIKQGFNLSKNPSIIKKFIKKGKNLAVNFADDAVNVISSLGQSN